MRLKKDYETVLKERIEDVKTLLLYFNVTRVRQYYTWRDGTSEFILASYDSDGRFWSAWKNKKIKPTPINRVNAGKLRKVWNKIHDIPWKLLHTAIGKFRHSDIRVGEVMKYFENDYKKFEAGKKVYKGDVKDSWCGKWIMIDKPHMMELLADPRYDNVETIPGASQRIIGIIKKWEVENGKFD